MGLAGLELGMPRSSDLEIYYDLLFKHFGPRHWWPGDSPFEIALGAILTQNTAWINVEKALSNLKGLAALSPTEVSALPDAALAQAIRPSGYYNQKLIKIRNFLGWLEKKAVEHSGEGALKLLASPSLDFLREEDLPGLRESLLSVKGVGPETADSILLYALELPSFVIDAYTWRMLRRHGFVGEDTNYYEMQALFTRVMPDNLAVYNEYHALIVKLGQEHCRKTKPLCASCPLFEYLEYPVDEEF